MVLPLLAFSANQDILGRENALGGQLPVFRVQGKIYSRFSVDGR